MTFWESCEQTVRSNLLQEAVGQGRLKMRCFTLDSVETHLGWCHKLCKHHCRVFIPVFTGTKSIKNDQETPEL